MSNLPENSDITRFIFDDDHYSQPDQKNLAHYRIKKNAISPMINGSGELETSVMDTTGMVEDQILQLGHSHVAQLRGEPLVALLIFKNKIVADHELYTINDKNGHVNHCAIKGWPSSKEDWLEKATDLAKALTNDSAKIFKVVQS